jgi:hypothetical protein
VKYSEVTPTHANYDLYVRIRATLREAEERIETWDDLFAFINEQALLGVKAEHLCVARSTILLLSSFSHALEQLPEEGDCKVVAALMMNIATYRPDLTGIDAVDLAKQLAVGLVETVLVQLAASAAKEGGMTRTETPAPKTTLH